MKNTFFGKIRRLFGTTLAIAVFSMVLAVAANAQSNNLYYQQGGAYYGRITTYSTHFEIATNDSVIKTFRNSCRAANSNGVAGVVCSFGQFRNGRHVYSGWGYFFQNGYVYLKWTNENIGGGGQWRQIDTPWYLFIPR